jgi:hypothetical protein
VEERQIERELEAEIEVEVEVEVDEIPAHWSSPPASPWVEEP